MGATIETAATHRRRVSALKDVMFLPVNQRALFLGKSTPQKENESLFLLVQDSKGIKIANSDNLLHYFVSPVLPTTFGVAIRLTLIHSESRYLAQVAKLVRGV
jgi:hypothetical protein